MKKIFLVLATTLTIFGTNIQVLAKDKEDSAIFFTSERLSDAKKQKLFEMGYGTIIEGSSKNEFDQSRSTYVETTCTAMKKRGYDWIGYSSECFQETYTAVTVGSGSVSVSISLLGVSISASSNVFTGNYGMSGSYVLSNSNIELIESGNYYSCIRMKAYSTKATYHSRVYDNGTLVNEFTYDTTYNYKNNKNAGIDYYLVVRTPSQCSQILSNNRSGTNSEVTSMNYTPWVNVSNPSTASILPWN